MQYITDQQGNRTGVQLTMEEWERQQRIKADYIRSIAKPPASDEPFDVS